MDEGRFLLSSIGMESRRDLRYPPTLGANRCPALPRPRERSPQRDGDCWPDTRKPKINGVKSSNADQRNSQIRALLAAQMCDRLGDRHLECGLDRPRQEVSSP